MQFFCLSKVLLSSLFPHAASRRKKKTKKESLNHKCESPVLAQKMKKMKKVKRTRNQMKISRRLITCKKQKKKIKKSHLGDIKAPNSKKTPSGQPKKGISFFSLVLTKENNHLLSTQRNPFFFFFFFFFFVFFAVLRGVLKKGNRFWRC